MTSNKSASNSLQKTMDIMVNLKELFGYKTENSQTVKLVLGQPLVKGINKNTI